MKRHKFISFWIPFFVTLTTYFMVPISPTYAQSFSLEMSPPVYEIVAPAGNTLALPYTLTNFGDPVTIQLSIYRLSMEESTGNLIIEPYENVTSEDSVYFDTDSLSIKVQTPFFIQSQQNVSFNLISTIPESADEKDYYYTLVAEKSPSNTNVNSSRINLQTGLGSNIIISVTGGNTFVQNVSIASFGIQPTYSINLFGKRINIVDSFQPIPISLDVANKGNNVVKASSSISSQKNLKIDTLHQDTSSYIFAQSQRSLYHPSTAILPGTFIGNYTLNAQIEVSNLTHPEIDSSPAILYPSVSFIVFPLTYSFILIGFVVGSILIITLISRFRQ